MHPMHRRTAVAAGLALVALASLAWAAVAKSHDEFGTPAVQPGDRWLYHATGAVPAVAPYEISGEWRVDKVAHHAAGPAQATGADGALHAGAALHQVRQYAHGDDDPVEIPVPSWHLVDGDGAGATVATATRWAGGGGFARFSLILPNGQAVNTTDRHVETRHAVTYGSEAPLCGFRHSLQGRTADGDEPLVLHGACATWDGAPASATLRPNGTADWQGREVRAYASAAAKGEAPAAEAWLDAAIPVPVRLRLGDATFELAGYEAGAVPEPHAFEAVDAAPAVAFAPRTAAGPDESGVDHPFPLSAAFAAAASHPDSGLGPYLRAHPGARVVAASFVERVEDAGSHREWTYRWTFTASDGASAHGVQVAAVDVGAMPPAPLPPGQPLPEPARGLARSIAAEPAEPAPGPWPAPHEMPGEMPTVASLLARWEPHKAAGRGDGNAWGFAADCTPSCAEGEWRTWAGVSRLHRPFEPVIVGAGVITVDPEVSTLEVGGDGASRLHLEVSMAKEESLDAPLLGLSGVPPAVEPAPDGLLALSVVPASASAVGLAATAAALALLLWPWAKSATLGLFSRVAGDAVLDNPRRAALLAQVEAEPGIHLRELARRSGLGEGATRHHLDRLVAAGLVRTQRGPGFLCCLPARGVDRRVAAAAPLLRSPVARRLLHEAVRAPGLSGLALSQRLGVDPSAVAYHVRRLSEAGMVATRRDGRFVLVEATTEGRLACASIAA